MAAGPLPSSALSPPDLCFACRGVLLKEPSCSEKEKEKKNKTMRIMLIRSQNHRTTLPFVCDPLCYHPLATFSQGRPKQMQHILTDRCSSSAGSQGFDGEKQRKPLLLFVCLHNDLKKKKKQKKQRKIEALYLIALFCVTCMKINAMLTFPGWIL